MRGLVVLELQPGPEDTVERVEIGQLLAGDVRQKRGADVAEEALDLAAPTRTVGAGMNERDVEGGADDL